MGQHIAFLAALPLILLVRAMRQQKPEQRMRPKREASLGSSSASSSGRRTWDPAARARFFEALDSMRLAEADWKRAIALDSLSAEWRIALGSLYFTKLRVLDAEAQLKGAIAVEPGSIDARSKLSEVYLMQGRYADAMAMANEALRIDPLNGSTYNLKGWIHRLAGDTNLAISSYQTAIERDPELYDSYVSLGVLHAARHNDLALSYYDNAIALRPGSIEALYNKAMYAQEHGRDSLALALYARMKEIDSDYPAPYYNTGYILLEHQRRIAEARSSSAWPLRNCLHTCRPITAGVSLMNWKENSTALTQTTSWPFNWTRSTLTPLWA